MQVRAYHANSLLQSVPGISDLVQNVTMVTPNLRFLPSKTPFVGEKRGRSSCETYVQDCRSFHIKVKSDAKGVDDEVEKSSQLQ